jgi:hypothetical protein
MLPAAPNDGKNLNITGDIDGDITINDKGIQVGDSSKATDKVVKAGNTSVETKDKDVKVIVGNPVSGGTTLESGLLVVGVTLASYALSD